LISDWRLFWSLTVRYGTVMVIDPVGNHWVKFVVKRVPSSLKRPHGISYSLTLHSSEGERLVGFDNAHAVKEKRGLSQITSQTNDHKHILQNIKYYEYHDATTLLTDFWNEVDIVLKQKGLI